MSIFPALKEVDINIAKVRWHAHTLDRIVADEDRLDLLKDQCALSSSCDNDMNVTTSVVGFSNDTCTNIHN